MSSKSTASSLFSSDGSSPSSRSAGVERVGAGGARYTGGAVGVKGQRMPRSNEPPATARVRASQIAPGRRRAETASPCSAQRACSIRVHAPLFPSVITRVSHPRVSTHPVPTPHTRTPLQLVKVKRLPLPRRLWFGAQGGGGQRRQHRQRRECAHACDGAVAAYKVCTSRDPCDPPFVRPCVPVTLSAPPPPRASATPHPAPRHGFASHDTLHIKPTHGPRPARGISSPRRQRPSLQLARCRFSFGGAHTLPACSHRHTGSGRACTRPRRTRPKLHAWPSCAAHSA